MADIPAQFVEALRDRYTLERELGRGGMATVYLAQDLRHDRPVALKVLLPELAATLGPERFQREIKLAARLQHPHILTVHDSGETAGQLWFTMPYVEGESLRDRLRRERQLSVEDALRITREAAQALQYAHAHGVVHRDIKPENLLLTTDGNTLVADFGIARALAGDEHLTQTGMSVGTPAYMSPEQASGDKAVDARADVYSLGCVLYEMLAGEPPYTGPTAQAIVLKRFTEPVPSVRRGRPSVPEGVDQAIQRALAPVPADRFATAAQFAQALQPSATAATPAATTVATPATGPLAPAPPPSPLVARARRLPVTAIALGVGFLIGLGVLFAWRRTHPGAGESAGPKVLAVLPFENLGDSADAYFADGITNELRGKLSQLPDIQVIARGSSNQYRHTTKAPQEIARELGVDYLLTATLQWEKVPGGASRVRVSPELVDVTPGHAPRTKWQQGFDASLTDVFQVQADIAGKVASALNVALGDSARHELAAKPTENLAAYDAYLRGKDAIDHGYDPEDFAEATRMYERAVALDPNFAAAFAELSITHGFVYWLYIDRSADRLARAKEALDRAQQLAPDLPETHLALANYYYRSALDYDRALGELATLERARPGDPDLARWRGFIRRRQGRWEESVAALQQAAQRNPRAAVTYGDLGDSYFYLRRYAEALASYDHALALNPGSGANALQKALAYLSQTGDRPGMQRLVPEFGQLMVSVGGPTGIIGLADLVPLLSREQQDQVLHLTPEAFVGDPGGWALARAMVYHAWGQDARARAVFESARAVLEQRLAARPDDHLFLAEHGFALAGLGRVEEAAREGMRAVEARPASRDAVDGPLVIVNLARIYTMVGRDSAAIDQLQAVLAKPGPLSPAWLRADPFWAPLRGNPRFERLVAGK